MPRSALIVDDSRTALTSLSRLLKAHDVLADLVESGPEALDFLRGNNPGIIFLDHMMPGMDGFETLNAIKSDPRTAAIPVVMYTSREGDAYMGQALMLGAFGVLQKPVKPDELKLILHRVDQLRPQRVFPGDESHAAQAGLRPSEKKRRPRAAVTGVIHVPSGLRARPDTTPGPAATRARNRHGSDVAADGGTKHGSQTGWLLMRRTLLVLVLLLPGIWFIDRSQKTEQQNELLQQENAALQAGLRAASELADAQERSRQQNALAPPKHGLLDTITWALNRHGQYKLNDEALGDTRLLLLRELIARLSVAGFQGTVRLETHLGEFCLVRDEQGNTREPDNSLPFSQCEVVSYPPAQAVQLSRRQSPAFARFLADRRPENPIQIIVVPHGASRPLVPYPDVSSVQTADDWNQAARLNQRVEILLSPVP